MFEQLEQYLKYPELFETTENVFWRDEHISKKLLEIHLDPNDDLASRKPEFIGRSATWIQTVIPPKRYRNLLDIGCGPGLYAERFARAGYSVTGIDFSSRSIEYARSVSNERNLAIAYVCEDYLDMTIEGVFDAAVLIYCDYGALSADNRKRVMKNVFSRLRSGGRFLLDVCSRNQYDAFTESQTWEVQDGGFWSAERYYCLSANRKYRENTTLNQVLVSTREGNRAYYIWNHCFTKEDLISEAEAAGFHALAVFGDIAGTPYTEDSMTIAILLEKP
ncbi:MAG: class I SAM-dependent methyltransferase [Eubacteriales bacterium]|nr:class I SAM-dependent methyltransferase [Eubacteriales bacterium]